MTFIYYTRVIKGKLYPKAARADRSWAYCVDIQRIDGKVVSKYQGIRQAPKDSDIEEK